MNSALERPCAASSVRFSENLLLPDDAALIHRIIEAYGHATAAFGGYGDSMWAVISERSRQLHCDLIANDQQAVTDALRYPANHDLLVGFDEAAKSIRLDHEARGAQSREDWGRHVPIRLARLAQAVGIKLITKSAESEDAETLLRMLDDRFGFLIDFPNPYPGELGFETSRGLANHRAVLALYQAWRLSILARKGSNTRVLEIGAGSGRTAYYARKFGLLDYTIIDLPLTNVAQANFLGRVLDPSLLVLTNEKNNHAAADRIRIYGPRWFEVNSEQFDIILNADSLTEIDHRQAVGYFEKIAQCAETFVSINHEANPFRVADLPAFAGCADRGFRYPFWLDDGYVEEVFFFGDDVALYSGNHVLEMRRLGKMILDQQEQIRRQDRELQSGRFLLRAIASIAVRRVRKIASFSR